MVKGQMKDLLKIEKTILEVRDELFKQGSGISHVSIFNNAIYVGLSNPDDVPEPRKIEAKPQYEKIEVSSITIGKSDVEYTSEIRKSHSSYAKYMRKHFENELAKMEVRDEN